MTKTEVEPLDQEWVSLLGEAKSFGLATDTVYDFLQKRRKLESFACQCSSCLSLSPLDQEWVTLMAGAKAMGLTIDTVREFLHGH